MYRYQAFQLTIDTELIFPELLPVNSSTTPIDVTIRYGFVDHLGLETPFKKSLFYQAMEGQLWLNIPNVARFLVTSGQHITVDPYPDVDEDSIRVYLLGSCFGAILIQRGFLLLHGNTIQINQHAVTFVGQSGAGKSTLSGAFFKRGCAILSDDMCVINQDGNVIPGFPQLKLWADAATQLAIDTTALRKIRSGIEKYAIPLGSRFCSSPLPLKMVYILRANAHDHISLVSHLGIEKFHLLNEQLFRPGFVKGLIKGSQHTIQCGKLANRITLVEVTRPQGYSLDKFTNYIQSDLIERDLSQEHNFS